MAYHWNRRGRKTARGPVEANEHKKDRRKKAEGSTGKAETSTRIVKSIAPITLHDQQTKPALRSMPRNS